MRSRMLKPVVAVPGSRPIIFIVEKRLHCLIHRVCAFLVRWRRRLCGGFRKRGRGICQRQFRSKA